MRRREFLQLLALAGLHPDKGLASCGDTGGFYGVAPFGNATLLHFTDCHAQLLPVHYREPTTNLGIGKQQGSPPHLGGVAWLRHFGVSPGTRAAHAFTALNFIDAGHAFGKMGGFAQLATLIKSLRASRGEQNCLLLDGGDTWQGSATALWTSGQDMLQACNVLGVDVMTGHWEFTYGDAQLIQNLAAFAGDFVAHNVSWSEEALFAKGDDNPQVFKPYVVKELPNARIAIIGQAFPYTPIANPKRFVANWQFGIEETHLQQLINGIRQRREADIVVLLSHNGMDVDLKLAARVSGLDFILGGHTHDAVPTAIAVQNPGGTTWVTAAGSHGKFLAVLDLQVNAGSLADFRYRLLPVFSELLPPDPTLQALVAQLRAPYLEKLQKPLATTAELLYRRDNFCGSFDQLLLDAQREVLGAQIALSPGFRWGTVLLPGQAVCVEDVYQHTAISYPETYVRTLRGAELKNILEDVCDNLFNPDPYYRQGGDMVRVGGLNYTCEPGAAFGQRISELRLDNGELLVADREYTVAGWAVVGEKPDGPPIWQVVQDYLQHRQVLRFTRRNCPKIVR